MASFLLWNGGKVKHMPHIAPHIPDDIHSYYEPFLGGGSVLLHVLRKADAGELRLGGQVVCNDINRGLIETYRAIAHDVEGVLRCYDDLCTAYEACQDATACSDNRRICLCKQCYYLAARLAFNAHLVAWRAEGGDGAEGPDGVAGAAGTPSCMLAAQFLFLNATCYRGLYRESKAGLMNSCYWTSRPILKKTEEIREAGRLFQKYGVRFECMDGHDFLCKVAPDLGKTDLVFVDPPYVPANDEEYEQDSYGRGAFGIEQTQAVLDWMYEHKDDCRLMYCNNGVEEMCAAFEGWETVLVYHLRRSLKFSGKATASSELLVTNQPAPKTT